MRCQAAITDLFFLFTETISVADLGSAKYGPGGCMVLGLQPWEGYGPGRGMVLGVWPWGGGGGTALWEGTTHAPVDEQALFSQSTLLLH